MKLPLDGRSHVSVDRSVGPPTGGQRKGHILQQVKTAQAKAANCFADVKLRDTRKRVLP